MEQISYNKEQTKQKMIQITDKSQCCGCTACASICAHDAITMQPDTLGFLYPVVNKNKCVDCELCEKVCAFNEHYDTSLNLSQPLIYAARHKNIHEVETSRSGAAFIALSDYILENGGVVYGVGYADHFRVFHKRATTKEERNEFKGSKYAQSDLNTTFRQVKKDLKNGLTVLFSGTPCQTAGLNSYIGKHLRINLILIDIICHGVPSPRYWDDYLTHIEKKYKSQAIKIDFRNKRFGWTDHIETIRLKNGKCIWSHKYTNIFYKNINLQYSCGNCHFTNFNRPSDITLGDFWGWEHSLPTFNKDDKGCSLLFINTAKGEKLLNKISQSLILIPIKKDNCLQPNLTHPTILHPQRKQFETDYKEHDFSFVFKKYTDTEYKWYIKAYIRIWTKKLKRFLIKI